MRSRARSAAHGGWPLRCWLCALFRYEVCDKLGKFYSTRYEDTRGGVGGHSEGETADICNRLKVAFSEGKNLNLLRCPCYERVSEKDAMKYFQCKMDAREPEPIIATWSRCQDNKVGHFPSLPGAGVSEYYSHHEVQPSSAGSSGDDNTEEMMGAAAVGAFGGVASVIGMGLIIISARRFRATRTEQVPEVVGQAVAMTSPAQASGVMSA